MLAALREALSNAARHAGATQVDVTVDVDADGMLTVQVTDNGTGIPADGRRSGLRNLASRAEKLGGELRLGAGRSGRALARDQAGMARPAGRPRFAGQTGKPCVASCGHHVGPPVSGASPRGPSRRPFSSPGVIRMKCSPLPGRP